MAPSAPARPPGRYDDSGGRPRPVVVATIVVLVTAFAGWVLWAALGAASPDVRSQLNGFEVVDAGRVRVSLTVTADAGSGVTCTVQADDRTHAPVGETRTTIRPGRSATRRATVVVRTRSRAVTAVLVGCRLDPPTG